MRISELSRSTGVSAHALRHYERLGLLRPARTPGGYRDYAESARREVVFIAMSRQIGFSLKAIAQHLPAYRTGRLGFDDMILAMHRRIAEIDRELASLRAQRKQVVDHVRWLRERKALRGGDTKSARRPTPRMAARQYNEDSPSRDSGLPHDRNRGHRPAIDRDDGQHPQGLHHFQPQVHPA